MREQYETIEASSMYACGVYRNTVSDQLNTLGSIKLLVLGKEL